jgi:hypothetical protein
MKNYTLVLLLILVNLGLFGQSRWQEIIEEKHTSHPNISSSLYQIGKFAMEDPAGAKEKIQEANLTTRSDGRIFVEVQFGWDTEKTVDFDFGNTPFFEIQNRYRNLIGGWILPDKMLELSEALPPAYIVRTPNRYSNDHEGITVTNALSYQSNGATGNGVRIAVIDPGFGNLGTAQSAGTAPSSPVTFDHTGSLNPFASGNVHGTGCTEIIFEYATGATFFLHKIAGESQLATAINQAIADNVDIISHSSSYFNTGWADGSGTVCAAVKDATDAGILYFHGAGNFHKRHWQGDYKDDDGDQWHEFNNLDETNEITIASGNSITAHLQWPGSPSATNDFDLYLFNDANGSTLATSTSTTDFETLTWTNINPISVTVELAVFRFNSTKVKFELFAPTGNDFKYGQTGGATASPANSLEDFCITVGAVNWNTYDSATPTIESFSSWGPTNGGIIVPDLCAPDGMVVTAYPTGFFGASAGGPNTAGMTAVLWSEHNYLSAEGVLSAVYGLAELYNDFGTPGHDVTYGRGGIELPDFTNNSRFVYDDAGNTAGSTSLPFINIEQANDLAPANTNIFFLGGTYNAPPTGQQVLSTPMIYKSLKDNAVIKGN